MSGWTPFLIALLVIFGSMLPVWAAAQASEAPPLLMLAKRFQGDEVLAHYSVSEKYDGVRTYWDGMQLMTRSGRIISVPDWFIADLPDVPMDGELWIGYGRFDEVSGLVRQLDGEDDPLWQEVRFMVFDLPDAPGSFRERYVRLRTLIEQLPCSECQLVEQSLIDSVEALDQRLQATIAGGGEGLMLHRLESQYTPGRSADLLKVTQTDDDEAVVLGYEPGKGRLEGLMGALRVRLADGREFLLGSGFTDAQRRNPPSPGERVRFTYRGLTSSGLPRFASFDRVRPVE